MSLSKKDQELKKQAIEEETGMERRQNYAGEIWESVTVHKDLVTIRRRSATTGKWVSKTISVEEWNSWSRVSEIPTVAARGDLPLNRSQQEIIEQRNSKLDELRRTEERERERGNFQTADAIARLISQHTSPPSKDPSISTAKARLRRAEGVVAQLSREIEVAEIEVEKIKQGMPRPISIEREDLAFLITWAQTGVLDSKLEAPGLEDALVERLIELKKKL